MQRLTSNASMAVQTRPQRQRGGAGVSQAHAAVVTLVALPWVAPISQRVHLSLIHIYLAAKATQASVARYGHAMVMPVPGFMKKLGLLRSYSFNSLLLKNKDIVFAHSDWAGYSCLLYTSRCV